MKTANTHKCSIYKRKKSLYKNISVEKKNGIRSCVNIQEVKDLWFGVKEKYFK